MMDQDDEAAEFGDATRYAQAAELGKEMFAKHNVSEDDQLIFCLQKKGANDTGSKYKSVMDFKVRVMELVSIYVQQRAKKTEEVKDSNRSDTSLTLIKGLLSSLKVAHQDNHQVLFDRAKATLSSMAKQGINTTTSGSEDALKDQKLLFTETMATILKPNKDSALNKAYCDVFLLLTKHHFG